jgi:hypothetical protein
MSEYTWDPEIGVSRLIKDILFKYFCNNFPEETGIILQRPEAELGRSAPNDLGMILSFGFRVDWVKVLPNKTIVNYEFDSSGKFSDISRYMVYAALLSHMWYLKDGTPHPVRTVVFYPAGVTPPNPVYTATESLLYSVIPVSLEDVVDGDALFAEIKAEIEASRNPFESRGGNMVKLPLATLGRVAGDRKEFCRDCMSLFKPVAYDSNAQEALAFVGSISVPVLGKAAVREHIRKEYRMISSNVMEAIDRFCNAEIKQTKQFNEELKSQLAVMGSEIAAKDSVISAKDSVISAKDSEIADLKAQLAEFKGKPQDGADDGKL